MKTRFRFVVSSAVMLGVISVASLAWACTPQNGATRVQGCGSQDGGPCGPTGWTTASGISVRARNIDSSASNYYSNTWKLYASEVWCHTGNLWDIKPGSTWNPVGTNPSKMIPGPAITDWVATGNIQSIIGNPAVTPPAPTAAWTATTGSYDICFNNGGGGIQFTNSTYPVHVTFSS